ncbi:MAG: ChaN family lipoprotein [Aquificaceae bacterium]
MFFKVLLIFFMISAINHVRAFDDIDVIYLPEEHTSIEDHQFQLRVIECLYKTGYSFSIGMEMFQQPFQRYLDDYIDCKITEQDMLEKTEYRKRWGYDPSLYTSIWRYAREKGIKLYALNLPTELLVRIKREGLKSVQDPILPDPIIDLTQEEKKRLERILEIHPKTDAPYFFDVQNAWDNVMAYAVVRMLNHHPDKKVVVLVGRGHAESLKMGMPYRVGLLKPDVRQMILRRGDDHLLFSMDLSKESSSASSIRVPNCNP